MAHTPARASAASPTAAAAARCRRLQARPSRPPPPAAGGMQQRRKKRKEAPHLGYQPGLEDAYELGKEIGRGGNGVVRLARHWATGATAQPRQGPAPAAPVRGRTFQRALGCSVVPWRTTASLASPSTPGRLPRACCPQGAALLSSQSQRCSPTPRPASASGRPRSPTCAARWVALQSPVPRLHELCVRACSCAGSPPAAAAAALRPLRQRGSCRRKPLM